MKKLSFILYAIAAVFMAGCATTTSELYYQYKSGEPNFEAARAKCLANALSAAQKIDCSQICGLSSPNPFNAQQFPEWEVHAPADGLINAINGYRCNACLRRKSEPSPLHYKACMAELGWVPCSQGGLHLPECQ